MQKLTLKPSANREVKRKERPAGKTPPCRGVLPFFRPVQPMAGAPAALRREGKTARDKARRHSKRAV